jgi:hypothetical protein
MSENYQRIINDIKINNQNYVAMDELQHNLAKILVELLNKTDDKNICTIIATIGVLEKIKECDDKSQFECRKTINKIKYDVRRLKEKGII